MTEIYLHFMCAHYGLYGNAPVLLTPPLLSEEAESTGGGGSGCLPCSSNHAWVRFTYSFDARITEYM